MPGTIPASETDALRAALWASLGQTTDDLTLALGSNATPQFIGALSELTLYQIGIAARDVEAFARHADRTTVESADVLLLARRSEELEKMMRARLEEVEGKR